MLICPAIDTEFSFMWPIKKTPRYNTLTQMPASGRGPLHIPLYQFPLWDFEWTLGYIPGDATGDGTVYQTLVNFFMGVQGGGQAFLFLDPYDNTVTHQEIGVTDGTTTQFTMYRTLILDGAQDLIQNFVSPPSIYVGGVLQVSGYSIDPYGTLTFTSAPPLAGSPPAGQAITWSGQFYFQCRFPKDSLDSLEEIMYQIWQCKTFQFTSELN